MLTSEKIKEMAKEAGADIVGIASMDRFEGLPKEMDPRQIFPEAKSMIVLGFRILRGCFRGIEEGTWFTAFSLMGYSGIRWVFQPICLWKFTKIIENEGYEAVPIVDNFPWTNIDNLNPDFIGQDFINVNRTMYGESEKYKGKWSKPVSVEKPAPDIFIPMKICAYLAGLGEIGYSGMFLTPEFGPRQRLAAIITDAPLEPDPLVEPGTICDRCMECVKACSVGAIPHIKENKVVRVKIAGKEIEWADIDIKKCLVGFMYPPKKYNPFIVTEEDERMFDIEKGYKVQKYKVPPIYFYARALEGARGCIRACMIHLEKRGKIKSKFKEPFRKRKPWVIEWEK